MPDHFTPSEPTTFIVHSVLDSLPLTPMQWRFYGHMVRRGGLGGEFFEALPNAAGICRMDLKTARRSLRHLVEIGLVDLVKMPPASPGVYRVRPVSEWPAGLRNVEACQNWEAPKIGRLPKTVGLPTRNGSPRHTKNGSQRIPFKGFPEGTEPPPALQFDPVKRGLYPREYEAMLAQVEGEIKTLVNDRQNYELRLAAESAHLIETLKAEGKEARAKEVEARADSWVKGSMKPEPKARLDAWKARRSEIKAAMAGIVPV